MSEFPDAASAHAFNSNIAEEFRANDGKVGGPFEGANMMLLHTTGAKSGQPRLAPLVYHPVDGKIFIAGSKGGAPTSPDWVHNLRAHPRVPIEIGTSSGIEAYDALARELPEDERAVTYAAIAAAVPAFADYQSKTTRPIPVFELVRA